MFPSFPPGRFAPLRVGRSAILWDAGEGVAVFEPIGRFGGLDAEALDVLEAALAEGGRIRALVLASAHPLAFSAGAAGEPFLDIAARGDRAGLEALLSRGQRLLQAMRAAPLPVVAAIHGLTRGGGLELALHADRLLAAPALVAGFPERWSGIVPGWGGCARTLARAAEAGLGPAEAAGFAFDLIAGARISATAEEARGFGLLRDGDAIVPAAELLPAACVAALALAEGYAPPASPPIPAAGPETEAELRARIPALAAAQALAPAEIAACEALAGVLCGGGAPAGAALDEAAILDLERAAFAALWFRPDAPPRMRAVMATGRRPD